VGESTGRTRKIGHENACAGREGGKKMCVGRLQVFSQERESKRPRPRRPKGAISKNKTRTGKGTPRATLKARGEFISGGTLVQSHIELPQKKKWEDSVQGPEEGVTTEMK